MPMRLLFAGMNGSGKSTLACSVYVWLRCQGVASISLHEIDVWSDTHACILGNKDWAERNKRGSDQENWLADEFAAAILDFASDNSQLVLGDLQGRWQLPTPEYWHGLQADGAILVGRQPTAADQQTTYPQHLSDWQQFLATYNIPIIAEVFSQRAGEPGRVGSLSVHGLDRRLVPFNPGVVCLSNWILHRLLASSASQ